MIRLVCMNSKDSFKKPIFCAMTTDWHALICVSVADLGERGEHAKICQRVPKNVFFGLFSKNFGSKNLENNWFSKVAKTGSMFRKVFFS